MLATTFSGNLHADVPDSPAPDSKAASVDSPLPLEIHGIFAGRAEEVSSRRRGQHGREAPADQGHATSFDGHGLADVMTHASMHNTDGRINQVAGIADVQIGESSLQQKPKPE